MPSVTMPKRGTMLRSRGDPCAASMMATAIRVQQIEPGGPIRPGTTTPTVPQVRPNRKNVLSGVSWMPERYWNHALAPISATTAPNTSAPVFRSSASRMTATPAQITATVALGWIEIPVFSQSVSRRMSAAQPINDNRPPSTANAPSAMMSLVGRRVAGPGS